MIKKKYELIPIDNSLEIGPASEYNFADGKGKIGIITAVSNPFCDHCNRIRMTADGKLRTCLFSTNETNLKELIRSGATDETIIETITTSATAATVTTTTTTTTAIDHMTLSVYD